LGHIEETASAIAEAQRLRDVAVADGDLDRVRKTSRRITDLKMDLDALAQGKTLLEAQVAKLDSEARIAACDTAAAELRPSLEDVCSAIEQFEDALIVAGGARVAVDKAYEAFVASRSARRSSLPDMPYYLDFTLQTFRSVLDAALEDCARWGFDRIERCINHEQRWSAKQRAAAEAYVADLQSKQRSIEEERAAAAVNGGSHG
jgi:hypothetical protein